MKNKISILEDISNLISQHYSGPWSLNPLSVAHQSAGDFALIFADGSEASAALLAALVAHPGIEAAEAVVGKPMVNLCLSTAAWEKTLGEMAVSVAVSVAVDRVIPDSADDPFFAVQHAQWRAGRFAPGLALTMDASARRMAGELLAACTVVSAATLPAIRVLLRRMGDAWETWECTVKHHLAARCAPNGGGGEKEAIQPMPSCALLAQATQACLRAGLYQLNMQPIEEWNA